MADYEQPNEEEEEETFGTEVQERAMFLLDLTTADLLEQTGAATFETRLEAAMKIVLAFIKGRLVGGGKDVRAFGRPRRDASSSIIYVFSAAAEPYASPAERDVCLTFAQDAADVALEVHVAHFGLDDELDAFWGPLLKAKAPPGQARRPRTGSATPTPPRAPSPSSRARRRARPRRGRLAELALAAGGGGARRSASRGARCAPGALAQKKVDANTGELVTTTSQDFDATTASILDASAIRTYVPLGPLADAAEADVKRANRCYVDRAQFKECDDASDVLGFGDGEVALLGFAARGDVLSALIEAMREERVVGLARYVKRKHAACPRLVVLAPDDRGLLFHELPFGDERRDTRGAPASLKRPREDEGDDAAETAAALDAALGALVAALSGAPRTAARGPGAEGPDSVVQRAWRDGDAQRPASDDALGGRRGAVERSRGGVAARAAKKPKPAAAARVPKELLVDPLNRDALKANFTAPALKATAEDLGLAKSGTKDAIINRIAQFLADGGQVPP
ncbi:hypothetical protein JL721_353 [Aureococcus anophagefferens]|nr:hypothetical protein JL721_353 [Aureococcus anophagefferens]